MYAFVTGPVLWLSFLICIIGVLYRVVQYIRGLNWQIDRVAYTAYPGQGAKGAAKSILHWIIPFGSRNWRIKPLYTIIFFAFHAGLILVPLFLEGHVAIVEQRWGISWPTLPSGVADALTITVFVTAACLIVRRIALPEVRILTTAYDYFLLALTLAPFVTGFFAVQEIGNPQFWLILHILAGEALLIAIPFTKLFHIVGFFLSRAQIGMDFGIKRGGMKGRGLAW